MPGNRTTRQRGSPTGPPVPRAAGWVVSTRPRLLSPASPVPVPVACLPVGPGLPLPAPHPCPVPGPAGRDGGTGHPTPATRHQPTGPPTPRDPPRAGPARYIYYPPCIFHPFSTGHRGLLRQDVELSVSSVSDGIGQTHLRPRLRGAPAGLAPVRGQPAGRAEPTRGPASGASARIWGQGFWVYASCSSVDTVPQKLGSFSSPLAATIKGVR